ncbi:MULTISPECIES: GNAT family N-acetyltransferase [unclassified Brevibacterium]|uniref:GNAT family N-acetyltransferase n=1 Tax=unclassified Brevibacterium TaxID=2614124 RepID=UPI001BB1BC77|nr:MULTISPECIES: GNAT family N-acetyltransferase [unclassified Brevibacterium]MCM1012506.1 GNAT family N-acetyltransferase [Brevibacterium sp. XM4083]
MTENRRPGGVSIMLMPPAAGLSADTVLDAAELDDLTRLLDDLVSGGAALGWIEPPSREEVSALLEDLAIATAENDARVALARSQGAVVGFAYWTRYTRPTLRRHVDVEKVAVGAAVQRAGIGRSLMTALISEARDLGVEVMTLDLRGDNDAAIRLYESLGFVRYGLLEGFVAVGDERYDTHFYALDLRGETGTE